MSGALSFAIPLPCALLGDIGGGEILVILGVALVLFGGKGLPGMARTLGNLTGKLQRTSQEFMNQLRNADRPVAPGSRPGSPGEPPPPQAGAMKEEPRDRAG